MTNEPPDDQMTFDIIDDRHEPITEENVTRILNILCVPPVYELAYEKCVMFLEPLDEELPIIERVTRGWCHG